MDRRSDQDLMVLFGGRGLWVGWAVHPTTCRGRIRAHALLLSVPHASTSPRLTSPYLTPSALSPTQIPFWEYPHICDIRTRPRNVQSLTGSKDLQMVNITLRILTKPQPLELVSC